MIVGFVLGTAVFCFFCVCYNIVFWGFGFSGFGCF